MRTGTTIQAFLPEGNPRSEDGWEMEDATAKWREDIEGEN
jgi:hypothetical protein